MKTKVLNDELCFSYHDEFREMDEAEITKLAAGGQPPQFAVTDPDRHMIITIGYRKIPGFSAMMLNEKDIAKKAEPQIAGPMKPFGYQLEGFVSEAIGNKNAEGFRYTYTAQEIAMYGETLAAKAGKNLYYIHCYFRAALKEESLKVLGEILAASSWK